MSKKPFEKPDGRSRYRGPLKDMQWLAGLSMEVNRACEKWLRERDPGYIPGGFQAFHRRR